MIEIRNKDKSPIQIMVRSRKASLSFTTLIIPGIGSGKNVILLEDEKLKDIEEVTKRVEKKGLISTRYIPNSKVEKGE